MSWAGPEPLLDAIIAHLKANIPTLIAAVNTEFGDGNDLVAPDADAYYISEKRVASIPAYPAVIVRALDDAGTLASIASGPAGHMAVAPSIEISVVDTDEDYDKLRRRLLRWQRRVIPDLIVGAEPAGISSYNINGPMRFVTPGALTTELQLVDDAGVVLTFAKTETRT